MFLRTRRAPAVVPGRDHVTDSGSQFCCKLHDWSADRVTCRSRMLRKREVMLLRDPYGATKQRRSQQILTLQTAFWVCSLSGSGCFAARPQCLPTISDALHVSRSLPVSDKKLPLKLGPTSSCCTSSRPSKSFGLPTENYQKLCTRSMSDQGRK